MKTNLRIIGDVHGKYEQYHPLIRKSEFTIQLGDFGFSYRTLLDVNPAQHKILAGNHDNCNDMYNWPHFLGDYGTRIVPIPGLDDIFFVRGGLSIDRHMRTEGVSWWANEELNMAECYAALAEYTKTKPTFVVSHECPASIVPYVTRSQHIIPSRTNRLLESMFGTHKPKWWIFGHYHTSFDMVIDGTRFQCLNELECLDL